MVASRNRPKAGRIGPFGLSVLALSLMPNQIGYQDLASLLVRQHDVSQRARAHALASPFGTIHAATFSFPRPLGSSIPEAQSYQLASLGSDDITGALAPGGRGAVEFPQINRRLKGDRLVAAPPQAPEMPATGTRDLTPGRVKTVSFPRPPQNPHLLEDPPARDELEYEEAPSEEAEIPSPTGTPLPAKDKKEQKSDDDAEPDVARAVVPGAPARTAPLQSYAVASLPPQTVVLPPRAEQADPLEGLNPAARAARLYFGALPVGRNVGTIERWPGDEPMLLAPPRAADPEIKQSALTPKAEDKPGQTVAPKGEVTGAGQRPKTPSERLGLTMKERAKAEKCMAEAVYFESRGETKRGQIAVAQVVLNRVFSGYYPNNVCGVVYQNAHRYNACQFTFACDKVKDVINEPDMWEQAKEIARDMLDGKLWLTDIGKSTHYHAYWVHPWWVGTMRKLSRIGVHTFYRPKRWGDGADAPAFGAGIMPQNVKL